MEIDDAGLSRRGSHSSNAEQSRSAAADDHLAESMALDEGLSPDPAADSVEPISSSSGNVTEDHDKRRPAAGPVAAPVVGPKPLRRGGLLKTRLNSRRKSRRKAPWWELPLLIAIAVVVAMLIKTFLVQPYYIPSESMEHTLYGCSGCSGDRILVNKPIYDFRDPHPGDIVVFKAPPGWDDEATPATSGNPVIKVIRWGGQLVGLVPPDENDLVKRVIAVGGQTVKCCDSDGNIQISDNGPAGPFRSLREPYIYGNLPLEPAGTSASDASGADYRNFGPVTIPKGRLWVMGDHRSASADSRWHYVHDYRGDAVDSTVPISAVIGKAVLIVWPPSRWRSLGTPQTFKSVALTAGGATAPSLGAATVVLPIWIGRRRRRRQRQSGSSP